MGIGRHCLQQIEQFQLLKQFALNHSKALFAHQRESGSPCDLAEGQLSCDHFFQVPAKRVGTEAGNMNGSCDLVLVFEESRHLVELLSVAFDRPEVFVDPDDDAAGFTALCQRFEAAQRVGKGLPAGDHCVDDESPIGLAQHRGDGVFDHVMPERYECGRAVIDDEGFVVSEDVFHKSIESPPVDLVPVHELEMLTPQRGILRKRLVHGVGVNADRPNAVVFIELRDETRDQAFADTALPLEGEVYGAGALVDCGGSSINKFGIIDFDMAF